jgi:hypothetical protein
MIPYIYYPRIDLDLNELQRIAFHLDGHEYDPDVDLLYLRDATFKSRADGLLRYQRPVTDHTYLINVQKRIPILGDIYNLYIFNPWEIVPTHIDSNRLAALNIPIRNTNTSVTSFYRNSNSDKRFDARRTFDEIDEVGELFSFNMTQPLVFNTSIPHRVDNHQSKFRVSLSWGFNCSFEEAVEFFESMSVL